MDDDVGLSHLKCVNFTHFIWEMHMTYMHSPAARAAGHGGKSRIGVDRDPEVAATRARLGNLARMLDSAIRIPGTSVRFGADAALNLIPGLGTLAAKGVASDIIYEARRIGVPKRTLLRMAANVGVDFVISAIPVVGWFGDVFYRANLKNVGLLQAHLDRRSGVIDGARTT
jgi:hypothetical protein